MNYTTYYAIEKVIEMMNLHEYKNCIDNSRFSTNDVRTWLIDALKKEDMRKEKEKQYRNSEAYRLKQQEYKEKRAAKREKEVNEILATLRNALAQYPDGATRLQLSDKTGLTPGQVSYYLSIMGHEINKMSPVSSIRYKSSATKPKDTYKTGNDDWSNYHDDNYDRVSPVNNDEDEEEDDEDESIYDDQDE